MSYLLVLAGIEGAALVVSGFAVVVPTTDCNPSAPRPITIPNNTISANILFIVELTFTKSAKMTSTIFRPRQG